MFNSYTVTRFIVLCLIIIDASIMAHKIGSTIYGLDYYTGREIDFHLVHMGINSLAALLSIFGFILLHHFCYGSFYCIIEILWTFGAWVVWLTFGIIASRINCLANESICNLKALLAGLAFLNWFLLLVLNITVWKIVDGQLKAGNRGIWTQMPVPSATVVAQTIETGVPLELQAPPVIQPPAPVLRSRHHQSTNVNPARMGDGRDDETPPARPADDARLGDGRDNV